MSFIPLAVISAIIVQLISWAWYEKLFTKKWAWIHDLVHPRTTQKMWVPIILNLVVNFLMAFTFFFLLGVLGVPNFTAVILVGSIILVGLILPLEVRRVIWSDTSASKKWSMFGISFGFQVVHFLIMALLFNWLA